MNALILVFSSVLAFSNTTFAQQQFPQQSGTGFGLGFGLEYVTPKGDFADIAGGGMGLHGDLCARLTPNAYLNLHGGFLSYGGVKKAGTEIQWGGVPMTVGIVYYPNEIDYGGLYVKGSGGILTRVSVNNVNDNVGSSTGTVVSVGAGFSANAINISADYNVSPGEVVDWNWFSIKAGIRIGP